MPDQPTPSDVFVPHIDEAPQAILNVLLDRHPALVSIEELVGYFSVPTRTAYDTMVVDEGVDDLVRWGLAHRLDQFAFASYTAVRGLELRG